MEPYIDVEWNNAISYYKNNIIYYVKNTKDKGVPYRVVHNVIYNSYGTARDIY
jgi:hypothetical protein